MSSERILKAVRRKAPKASRIKQGFLKCIKLVTLKIQAQRIHGLLASTSAATPLSGGKESCGSDSTLSSEAHSRSTYAPSQHNPKSRDFFCKIFKISRAWVCLFFKVALNSNKNILNIEWSWGRSTNLWCLEVSSTIIAFQHRSNSRHLQLKGKMILHSLLLAVTPVKRCGKVPRKKTRRNPGIQTKDRRSIKGACFQKGLWRLPWLSFKSSMIHLRGLFMHHFCNCPSPSRAASRLDLNSSMTFHDHVTSCHHVLCNTASKKDCRN